MTIHHKFKNAIRSLTQRWGSYRMKQRLWNSEFSNGRWECLEGTENDIIYEYLEKYCRNGCILDLGCGSGNTGCELNAQKYVHYTGIDISDVALEKARSRSEACQRSRMNHYIQSDISTFVPDEMYDVILFRESIYYLPLQQIVPTLKRYTPHLKEGGVFIIRWHDARDSEAFTKALERQFKIIERLSLAPGPMILVLGPKIFLPQGQRP